MNIAEIVRKNLQQSELYLDTQQVMIEERPDFTFIGYYSRGQQYLYTDAQVTHFELSIIDTTCKLLHIAIDKQHRGKGHGRKLYQIIENIAKELRCTRVIAEPKGTTHTGEPRRAYMQRLGYQQLGEAEVEKTIA